MLAILLLGRVEFIIFNLRKLKLFKGHLFSYTVKIMLFISYVQYYVPVKLYRGVGSIHLSKITKKLLSKHAKLNKQVLWDILEIDWKEANMTLNGIKIELPTSVIIPLREKFKIRRIIQTEPLLSHIMLEEEMTWFASLVKDS